MKDFFNRVKRNRDLIIVGVVMLTVYVATGTMDYDDQIHGRCNPQHPENAKLFCKQ